MFTEPQNAASTPMADTPIRKFMFEQSFDGASTIVRAPERKPVTLKPEQVDDLKRDAFDAGFTAGKQEGAGKEAQQLTAMMERIAAGLDTLAASMQAQQEKRQGEMRALALAVVRKILPTLVGKYGEEEIHALIGETLAEMTHEPRLVVRLNESQFDAINAKITEITAQKAYAGKVVVLADDGVAAGDCRIEWADGGVERNTQATLNDIEKVVAPAATAPETSAQE